MKTLKINFIMMILILPALAKANQCYQASVPAGKIVGAARPAQMTFWIHDSRQISDQFLLTADGRTTTLAVWCRDLESEYCAIDAGDQSFAVKQSKDSAGVDQLEFQFPGKLRISAGSAHFSFMPTRDLGARNLVLKKVDEKLCSPTTLRVPVIPPIPQEGTGRQ